MKNSIRQFIFILIATLFVSGVFTGCTPAGPKALLQGENLLKEGRPKDAVKKLEKAASYMPSSALVYNHLGIAYHKAGMLNKAYEAYAKAAELSPKMEAIHYNRACLFYDTTNYTMAIRELDEFIKQTPVIPEKSYILSRAYKKYGLCCLNLRKNESAVICFRNTLALTPKDADTYNTLGYIAVSQKNEKTAFEYFQKAIEVKPNYSASYLNCGIIFRQFSLNSKNDTARDSNNDAALQYFGKFISLEPSESQSNTARKLIAQINGEKQARENMARLREQNENISKQKNETDSIKLIQPTQTAEVAGDISNNTLAEEPLPTLQVPVQVAQSTISLEPQVVPQAIETQIPETKEIVAVVDADEVDVPEVPVQNSVEQEIKIDVPSNPAEVSVEETAISAQEAEVPEKTNEETPANTDEEQPLIIDGREVEAVPQEATEMFKISTKIENLDKLIKEEDISPIPENEDANTEPNIGAYTLADQMEKLQVDLPEPGSDSLDNQMQKLQVNLPEKKVDAKSKKSPTPQKVEVKSDTTIGNPVETKTPAKKKNSFANLFRKNKTESEESVVLQEENVSVIPVEEENESETTSQAQQSSVFDKKSDPEGEYKNMPRYNRTLPTMPKSKEERDILAIDHFNTATHFYSNRDYKQAIVYFTEATKKEPAWFEAHKSLAVAYLKSRLYEQALEEFKKAIAIKPGDWQTHYNFALALNTAGYPLDAVEELNIAGKLNPDSYDIYLALGNIYDQKLHDTPNAAEAYKMYVQLSPNTPNRANVGRWLKAHASK